MFLDAVRPEDSAVIGPKRRYREEDAKALRTDDISGAQPTYPWQSRNMPGKEAIPGTTPRKLWNQVNKVIDTSLRTSDIEYAQPAKAWFSTGRRVDPVNPQYDLPTANTRPPTPPGPMLHQGEPRETFSNRGLHVPRIRTLDVTRNPNDHDDIEYSRPNYLCNPAAPNYKHAPVRDPMNDKIIEKAGERILSCKAKVTPRTSNPLVPDYQVLGCTVNPHRQGDPEESSASRQTGTVNGSTPRQLTREQGLPQYSLLSRDIDGAVPQRRVGSLAHSIYNPNVTPRMSSTLQSADIPGAQVGTRKPGDR